MTTRRREPVRVGVQADVKVTAGRNAPVRAVLKLEDVLRQVREGLAPAARPRRGAKAAPPAVGTDPGLPAALAELEKALRRQRARARRAR